MLRNQFLGSWFRVMVLSLIFYFYFLHLTMCYVPKISFPGVANRQQKTALRQNWIWPKNGYGKRLILRLGRSIGCSFMTTTPRQLSDPVKSEWKKQSGFRSRPREKCSEWGGGLISSGSVYTGRVRENISRMYMFVSVMQESTSGQSLRHCVMTQPPALQPKQMRW